MTDLEMTRLCAEAIGIEYEIGGEDDDGNKCVWMYDIRDCAEYCPLQDDEQAMELVKRFRLQLMRAECFAMLPEAEWGWRIHHDMGGAVYADLNRAIVECVANMQASKT